MASRKDSRLFPDVISGLKVEASTFSYPVFISNGIYAVHLCEISVKIEAD
jgi:hypothetical protein